MKRRFAAAKGCHYPFPIGKELCTLRNIQDIDLEGKTVYNPEKNDRQTTESGPKGPEALRGGQKDTKKKDL